jgi:hypothetical protein
MSELYKFQRPLAGGMDQCLVYNESQSFMCFVPYAEAKKLFESLGNPMKFYARATFHDKNLYVIDSIPAKQEYDW